MEPQRIRTLLPPHSEEENGGGGGPHKRVEEGKKNLVKEGSELNKLGEDNRLIKHGKPVLTPSQLNEFQQQALIFKHMKAGLPVPLHLVIPVWKFVASSFGSDIGGIYKQYPSFVGFIPQEFDHRNMMDPQPGRCRRTDGKKWRCSKNVVPDQKYCERHMHRGRQRSRKHVETSQIAYPSDATSAKDSDYFNTISTPSQSDPHPPSPLGLPLVPPSDSKNSKAVSTFFQFTTPSSSSTGSIVTTTSSKDDSTNGVLFSGISNGNSVIRGGIDSATTIVVAASTTPDTTISITSLSPVTTYSPTVVTNTTNDRDNDVCGSKNSASIIPNTTNTVAATTPTPTSNPNTGTSLTMANTITAFNNNKNNQSAGWKCDGSNNTNIKRMINRSGKSGNSHNSNVSPGLDFSPKSVLQVAGCRGSYFYRSEIELEPGRCRRTDGKKWRCSRAVVPDQKYCVRHMHRGAKKRVEASQAVTNFTTVTSSVCLPRMVTVSKEADSATLDTNLSISIPASPRLVTNDEKSPTSSSDATISDTTITAYENSNYCS